MKNVLLIIESQEQDVFPKMPSEYLQTDLEFSAIQLSPENAEKVTLASCALHNFLSEKSPARYTSPGSFDTEDIETGNVIEGEWRSDRNSLESVRISGSNNSSFEKEVERSFVNILIVSLVVYRGKTSLRKKMLLTNEDIVFLGFIVSLRKLRDWK